MSPPDTLLDENIIRPDAFTRSRVAMVITNPNIHDNPIVYVSKGFESVTGYSSVHSIGRNCRFLQGPDTDPADVQKLREGIARDREVSVEILNYRADGSSFRNKLMITPLYGLDDTLVYFLGIQTPLEEKDPNPAPDGSTLDEQLAELQHRVKNHLSMIVSLIRLQARGDSDSFLAERDFATLARRVEALQLLYEEMTTADEQVGENRNRIDLGAYLTRVANAVAHLDGRSGVRVNIQADAKHVGLTVGTQLGLILSEVLTNAMQHAFVGRDIGLVDVRMQELSGGLMRLQITDDGIGLPEGAAWPSEQSLGGRIVSQLVTGLEASLAVERDIQGTMISIDVPADTLEREDR